MDMTTAPPASRVLAPWRSLPPNDRIRVVAVIAVIAALAAGWTTWRAQAAGDSQPSNVVTIDPTRILDTRDSSDLGLDGPFTSATPQQLRVAGAIATADGTATVVPDGATGVLLNVTAVRPSAAGFVSIEPGDATGTPTTSSLNVGAGEITPNAVTVALPTVGADAGTIRITFDAFGNPGPTTDLLIDVVGYLTPAGVTKAGGAVGPGSLVEIPEDGTPDTVHSITFDAPAAGTVVVNVGVTVSDMAPDAFTSCGVTEGTTLPAEGVMIWESAGNDFDGSSAVAGTIGQLGGTRSFTVDAGSHTFNLVCSVFRGNGDGIATYVTNTSMTYVYVAD